MSSSVTFDSVREKNLMQLRKINSSIFPIRYQDKFYKDALNSGEFTKLAFYGDIYVGAVACRLEKRPTGGQRLYIMTLGVLAPYRRRGIGSKLLHHSLSLCLQDPSILEIYLHVQTNNEEAIHFYTKYGFRITETVTNYYRRIEPPDCHVLTKEIEHTG